ncbi:MAG: MBL fold metallo-hydrolase [Candidatus Magasanikbacteria bacterium]|nr:MBL fold metallo-hydrolase [Candidatus Magasanikbacteria bacterium]
MKKILYSLLLFSACLAGGLWLNRQRVQVFEQANFSASALKVIFFDVGQGDSALIKTPAGKKILVDGGPDDKILSKLGENFPLNDKKIDVMILTHPHADHLEGLISVLRRYEVGGVYYSGVIHTTAGFLEWLRLIKDKNIPMKIIKGPEKVEMGGAILEFLYPNKDLSFAASTTAAGGAGAGEAGGNGVSANDVGANAGENSGQESKNQKNNGNLNNASVVFKLSFGRTSFLFMGDAETPLEDILLKNKVDLKADVLKAGHHGSNTSSGEDFLRAVSPEWSVISVGKNNDYGHPHLRVLRRLERHGIKILRTDEVGDIKFESDGEKIDIK